MTRWKLFSYLSIDHKAAQADLNAMAAKGWQLCKIYGGLLARLERTDRADLRYFVDLADPRYKEEPGYLSLCADAGWDEVCAPRYMRIYESRPGCDPTPIQTDGGVECDRFLRICFRRMLITLGIAVLMLLGFGLLFVLAFHKYLIHIVTGSFMGAFLFLGAVPLMVGFLLYSLCILLRIRAWKALRASGEPIPVPRFARLRGMLTVLGSLFLVSVYATMGFDYGTHSDLPVAGYLVGILIAIPVALWFKENRPQRRLNSLIGNPILCMVVFALLLRLLPAGAYIPFTVKPAPLPAPLVEDAADVETHSYWLSAEDTWYGSFPSEGGQDFSALRFTLRTPEMAGLILQSQLQSYMEPVPGLPNTWWVPNGKPRWSISELVFLRGNTVWYFSFYTTYLPPYFPAQLDKIIAGKGTAS